jgi:thioredoxin 1
MVKHINTDNFEEEVIKAEGKVLVDFFATWCGPCTMLAPVLEQVADSKPEVKIVKVDVDEEPELATRYKVMSIPTLMVFEKGEVVKKSLGVISKAELLDLIG